MLAMTWDDFSHPHDECPWWKQEQKHVHESTQASFHDDVPLIVWDDTQ